MWLILVPLFILGRLCYKFYQFVKVLWKIEDSFPDDHLAASGEEGTALWIVRDDEPEESQTSDNTPHWKLVERKESTHPII